MDTGPLLTFSPKNRLNRSAVGAGSRKYGNLMRAQQSQVIYRSSLNILESFGPALPVLVREALTFSERNATASVKVSLDGWAWFVCGRKLLVWPCLGEESRRRQGGTLCRELNLPSSDLAYRADHVVIFTAPGQQVPSCIAASPEGLVRYWPSVAHEGTSIEVNAHLQGQECDSLTDMGALGIILATTTASVVLVKPDTSSTRPSLTVQPLRPPQGWFGGITRLIPSLMFGSQTAHSLENKLVKVLGTPSSPGWLLQIVAGPSLQQWLVNGKEIESLVSECQVTKMATEAFHKTVWESCGGNSADIAVWLLDAQVIDGGVMVLMGATNPNVSPQFFYGLGTLLTGQEQLNRFDRFCPIKSNMVYRESDEADLLGCRFLLYGTHALLFTRRKIYAISAINFGEDADELDVVGPLDEVLGASLCRGVPVIFTRDLGFFSVSSAAGARTEFNLSVSDAATADTSISQPHLDVQSLAISDPDLEEIERSSNPVYQVLAAFIHYLRMNFTAAENILGEAWNPAANESALVGWPDTINRLSALLLDAQPVADPRWAPLQRVPAVGPPSLQVAAQLEDKARTVDAFLRFLKWAKLWDKFHLATEKTGSSPLCKVLMEHREKIVAMSILKTLHNSYGSLMDECIRHVVNDSVPEGLTKIDLFYCQVSEVQVCLGALVDWSEALAHSDRRPQDVASCLLMANQILLKTLEAVLEWRSSNIDKYVNSGPYNIPFEFLPWTAAIGNNGLRESLVTQHSLTLKYGARAVGDVSIRSQLYEQLLKLADVILDGYKSHVNSTANLAKYDALLQQYETARRAFIEPLVSAGEYERAILLAEKYLDFHSLVEVCEVTNNMERLDGYCNSFAEKNFIEYLVNWYIREGKPGHLLERFHARAKPTHKQQLCHLLTQHPSLSWLQDMLTHNYVQAHTTLESLAQQEKQLLQRKKSMVSLSKLSLLASNEDENLIEDKLNELDQELQLIGYQEDIPTTTLTAHGYHISKMGVLTASEIIKLYISDQNEEASEGHYKRALDLLAYVADDMERSELKQSIWCSAILRDLWSEEVSAESPVEAVNNLFFFKLVDELECMGCNLDEAVPPISTLLEAEELGDLRNEAQFQYLLRLGYEHYQKISV